MILAHLEVNGQNLVSELTGEIEQHLPAIMK